MHIHWPFLIAAFVMLLCPVDVFCRRNVCMRNYERLRDERGRKAGEWWLQPGLFLDALRAFAGGWLLRTACTLTSSPGGLDGHLPVVLSILIMGVALILQMHTSRKRGVVLAPVGFCAGLVFALLPAWIAVLVILLAVSCLVGFRGWSAFFLSGALAAGALGFLTLRFDWWMLMAVVLMFEPLLVSLLVGRELVVPLKYWRSAARVSGLDSPLRNPRMQVCR